MKKASWAQIDLSHARFSSNEDLGIDFRNEIDAWTKMEKVFCHQIRSMKDNKSTKVKTPKKKKEDLRTLVYSVRQRLD
jgi:hypothetical protein